MQEDRGKDSRRNKGRQNWETEQAVQEPGERKESGLQKRGTRRIFEEYGADLAV